MADYIDRQEVLDAIQNVCKRTCTIARIMQKSINELPSADVQPVVRCKGCKYFESTDPYEGWCHTWSDMTVDDGYCSYGERKDGEQND